MFDRYMSMIGWRVINGTLISVGALLLITLEGWAAWYAMASAPSGDLWPTPWGLVPRAALLHGFVGAGFGCAAFLAMIVAGNLSQDERPRVRKGAFLARIVALGLVLVPIGNLAGAINMDHRLASWSAYVESPAYLADKNLVEDAQADTRAKAEAALNLIPPTSAEFDFVAYAQAAFFHLMVALLASIRMAPPITQEERNAVALAQAATELKQRRAASAKKGMATRAKNAAKKKTQDRSVEAQRRRIGLVFNRS